MDRNAQVGIVGVGQTAHCLARNDVSLPELIFEATTAALEDAQLTRDQIDAVIIAAHDLVDGRGISSMITATAAGGMFRDEIRVADDGAFAAILGCMRILSGEFQSILVCSWSKCSESPIDTIENLGCDPILQRPLGITGTSASALQADRFSQQSKVNERLAADVVVRNRANGCNNQYAHLRAPITPAQVLESALIATPLRLLDVPPRSDGACAMVIQADTLAVNSGRKVAWINGLGWGVDSYFLGDRTLGELPSATAAAKRAYAMANISDPAHELDLVEVHSLSSYHELMLYQALNLCGQQDDAPLRERVEDLLANGVRLNPSGGTFCANPYTATGLVRIAEASLQVMGRATGRQVDNAATALAHACSGLAGQANAALLISDKPRN
jgi:acetyl-CoA C-acetyltransferase